MTGVKRFQIALGLCRIRGWKGEGGAAAAAEASSGLASNLSTVDKEAKKLSRRACGSIKLSSQPRPPGAWSDLQLPALRFRTTSHVSVALGVAFLRMDAEYRRSPLSTGGGKKREESSPMLHLGRTKARVHLPKRIDDASPRLGRFGPMATPMKPSLGFQPRPPLGNAIGLQHALCKSHVCSLGPFSQPRDIGRARR
jgi:hypothetical protein